MTGKFIIIAGARPNFMKIAPVIKEIEARNKSNHILIHTGQHYNKEMSKVFFTDLGIPQPKINLEVGSMSDTDQRARIMERLGPVFKEEKPDLVIVVGDVNSTIAAAMTACECHIPVAHVEAGLRSFDMTMPEELNRILTDRLSRFLFVTEESGILNLRREGIEDDRIFFVGNVMIDNLLSQLPLIEKASIGIPEVPFLLVTLHRPSNVDTEDKLRVLIDTFKDISKHVVLVFPIHPRTLKNLRRFDIEAGEEISVPNLIEKKKPGIYLLPPLGYHKFMKLVKNSNGIITDSGGIQEETTILKIPCFTIRENTERPVTIEMGTNTLIGSDMTLLKRTVGDILNGKCKPGEVPPLWDGKTAERIVDILEEKL